ncbi:hypothetical protein ACJJTC_001010 [Scirpophaga incertulas]
MASPSERRPRSVYCNNRDGREQHVCAVRTKPCDYNTLSLSTIAVREVYLLLGPCDGAPRPCVFHSVRPGPAEGGRRTAYFVWYRRRPPRVPLTSTLQLVEISAVQGEKTPFKLFGCPC